MLAAKKKQLPKNTFAEAILSGQLNSQLALQDMPDDEVRARLTALKA